MANLNDQMVLQLRASGHVGNLQDMLFQAFGGAPGDNLNSLWFTFLGSLGHLGSLNDRMLAWYRAESGLATAALNDAALATWTAGDPIAPP